jgi:hypothetical protein
MPDPSRLIMPARIISLWLTISASAGASLSVEIKNRVARMTVILFKWKVIINSILKD